MKSIASMTKRSGRKCTSGGNFLRAGTLSRLFRPDAQRGFRENLLLTLRTERERAKLVEIFFDVGYAGPRPVCPEQSFLRDLIETRKIFEQRIGRNSADVQKYVGVPSQ